MHLDQTVAALQALAPRAKPRVAVVLGSGWGALAERVERAQRLTYADLPGFPAPGVAGHGGVLLLGHVGAQAVAVMSGRKHAYETGEPIGMKLPLRALRQLGCEVLVQTNAAGSLRSDLPPGSLMLLTDHLNLPQRSPLTGEEGSGRFVAMTDAYDPGLRQQALAVAQTRGQTLHQGVYAMTAGPQFETPAEVRMIRLLGADAVGMSTVPETIIARHAGMRVLALSLITNMGAGMSDEVLSHAHTLAQADAAAQRAGGFLAEVIANLMWPADGPGENPA